MRSGGVKRPAEKSVLISKLVKDPEDKKDLLKPFDTYRDLMLFAACLGYANEQKTPIQKGEFPIPWDILSNKLNYEGLIYALGIAETHDTQILAEDRTPEMLKVFEDYWNGGLEIIEDWLNASPGSDPIDVITRHILATLDKVYPVSDALLDTELSIPQL